MQDETKGYVSRAMDALRRAKTSVGNFVNDLSFGYRMGTVSSHLGKLKRTTNREYGDDTLYPILTPTSRRRQMAGDMLNRYLTSISGSVMVDLPDEETLWRANKAVRDGKNIKAVLTDKEIVAFRTGMESEPRLDRSTRIYRTVSDLTIYNPDTREFEIREPNKKIVELYG
ncbi:MAG: hypothetical protein ABIA21_03115 [Candidatus Aenigmatarchaeota archaeon]